MCICLLGPVKTAFPKTDTIKVYFYNTETSINNFKSLKMAFDQYFSRFGNYEFQPFKDRTAFESAIRDARNGVVIISSWHYRQIYKTHSLTPMLLGKLNGGNRQKRMLVTRATDSLKDWTRGTLASASNVQHTRTAIVNMVRTDGVPRDYKSINILKVPKDIDALMSVGFGMSTTALATETSFKRLEQINPGLCQKLRIVAEGCEAFLTVLAAPAEHSASFAKIINIIYEMPQDDAGKKQLEMIGLDGWQRVSTPDKNALEQDDAAISRKCVETKN